LLQRDFAQRLNPRGKQRDGNARKARALRRRHPSLGAQKEWKSNLAGSLTLQHFRSLGGPEVAPIERFI
jgi:hypothetical protein